MLDSARQVIRWAIPGWLFFSFASLFFAVEWAWRARSGFQDHLLRRIFDFGGLDTTVFILTVAGIGIPLGYLFYQLYYWGYWRGFEFERDTPKDKGLAVLRYVNIDTHRLFWDGLQLIDEQNQYVEEIPYVFSQRVNSFFKDSTGRNISIWGVLKNLRDYNLWLELTPWVRTRESAARFRHNWFLAESVFYKTVLDKKAKYWEDRAVFMADVYHSLGTVRVTLTSAFLLYTLITAWSYLTGIDRGPDITLIKQAAIWLSNFVWAYLVYVVLRANRRTTRDNLITLKRHAIISYSQQEREENISPISNKTQEQVLEEEENAV